MDAKKCHNSGCSAFPKVKIWHNDTKYVSKGLAKGGGKDFHKAGSVWHAGDVVEMTVHENNHVVFSLNTVLVFEVHKIKAQHAAVSMWSSGTSLQILN